MATIKLKFRPSSIPGKEGVLVYQVTQARVIKQIKPVANCLRQNGTPVTFI